MTPDIEDQIDNAMETMYRMISNLRRENHINNNQYFDMEDMVMHTREEIIRIVRTFDT